MSQFTLALDSSQITAFLQCPRYWMWAYRRNIQKRFGERKAMDKGTVIHGLLERYYRALAYGKDKKTASNEAISALQAEWKGMDLKLTLEEFQFCVMRFSFYQAYYAEHDFSVMVREGHPAVEVGFSYPILDAKNFLFVLEGRIDFIGEQQGIQFVVDHKTQGRKYDYYGNSIQFKNYALATGVNRTLVNYVGMQEKIKEDSFRRQLFYYDPIQLRQWKIRLTKIFFQMADAISRDDFEMRESSCPGHMDYFCQFTKLCESTSPHMVEQLIQINYEKRREWKPWHEHEGV